MLEGTKCPMAALSPEAIFNYVLTVEEYVFALSVCFCSFKCYNQASFKKEPGKLWKVRETTQMNSVFIHLF